MINIDCIRTANTNKTNQKKKKTTDAFETKDLAALSAVAQFMLKAHNNKNITKYGKYLIVL